jgi:hypothetical protein
MNAPREDTADCYGAGFDHSRNLLYKTGDRSSNGPRPVAVFREGGLLQRPVKFLLSPPRPSTVCVWVWEIDRDKHRNSGGTILLVSPWVHESLRYQSDQKLVSSDEATSETLSRWVLKLEQAASDAFGRCGHIVFFPIACARPYSVLFYCLY